MYLCIDDLVVADIELLRVSAIFCTLAWFSADMVMC